MSVVAAQAAAVGPTPVAPPPAVVAVPYGLCGGARKRKDVVQEEVAEGEGRGDGDDDAAWRRRRQQHGGHGLFVLETVEEERSSIGAVSDEEEEEGEEVESKETSWRRKKDGGITCLDALDDALPINQDARAGGACPTSSPAGLGRSRTCRTWPARPPGTSSPSRRTPSTSGGGSSAAPPSGGSPPPRSPRCGPRPDDRAVITSETMASMAAAVAGSKNTLIEEEGEGKQRKGGQDRW